MQGRSCASRALEQGDPSPPYRHRSDDALRQAELPQQRESFQASRPLSPVGLQQGMQASRVTTLRCPAKASTGPILDRVRRLIELLAELEDAEISRVERVEG